MERINIIRKEELTASAKVDLAKQTINKERKKNNELITTLKIMKEDQNLMYEKQRELIIELNDLNKIQEELHTKVESEKHKPHKQKVEQCNERTATHLKLKEKDDEIHESKGKKYW